MRLVLHLSDIHFGKTDPVIIEKLLHVCKKTNPDIIVISGDFTQRAQVKEFEEAQSFLKELTTSHLKILAIPGNHDIRPLYSLIKRIRNPYDRYARFIAPLVITHFVDSEIALFGLNTVRAKRIKDGHVGLKDVGATATWFSDVHEEAVRILVTHHPLDLPSEIGKRKLAHKAARGVGELAKAHIDVYLSGHYHKSSAVSTRHRYSKDYYGAVAVQAGTISTRTRGEHASFNLLRIEREKISITPYQWQPVQKDFVATIPLDFTFQENHWAC